jgi:hypothetical protein
MGNMPYITARWEKKNATLDFIWVALLEVILTILDVP